MKFNIEVLYDGSGADFPIEAATEAEALEKASAAHPDATSVRVVS